LQEYLPCFPYHPDPVGTGSVKHSPEACACCGRARGFVYDGPIYSRQQVGLICPWCIADGSAAERYRATFTDASAPAEVPREVIECVERRTPGFTAWQQEQWMFHCGDGAIFLGVVGAVELAAYPDAVAALREQCERWGWSPQEREAFLKGLAKEGDASAYLFRCRHCDRHIAYADFT
jgi:uncharacterized protein